MAKILVIEDDPLIQNLLVLQLQDKAHQVMVADNGREGISMALSENPQLIIMDLRLPVLDGCRATETLKSTPETAMIPVLLLTAQAETAVWQQCLIPTQYDGYVRKPINFSHLFAQIDTLTNKI